MFRLLTVHRRTSPSYEREIPFRPQVNGQQAVKYSVFGRVVVVVSLSEVDLLNGVAIVWNEDCMYSDCTIVLLKGTDIGRRYVHASSSG